MNYLANLNLNKNEIQNAVIHKVGVLPANAISGQICYLTTDNKLYVYNGSEWKDQGCSVVNNGDGTLTINGEIVDVSYELPTAAADTLGGVKIGSGLEVDSNGVVSVTTEAVVAQHFEGTKNTDETDNAAITRIVGDAIVHAGDTLVLKTLIATDKYSYMGFVYDGSKWAAMDGNVSADNVILDSDITLAGSYTAVGNVTKANNTATGTLAATGKSVSEIFQSIFTKELNPTKTEPAVSITLTGAGAKEVGTSFTPTYSASLSAGSYTYGPVTGITASSWEVTDTNGGSSTEHSGSFDAFTVGDSTNYNVSATATYGDGAIPVTNIGNEYAGAQIKAGSKSKTSASVTGFRSYFYGTATAQPETVDSAFIRGLTNANKAIANTTFDMSIPEGAKCVYIAFLKSANKSLTKVADQNAFGTDIVGSFVESSVMVEGLNGYTAAEYEVYTYVSGIALPANTYKVTIS